MLHWIYGSITSKYHEILKNILQILLEQAVYAKLPGVCTILRSRFLYIGYTLSFS